MDVACVVTLAITLPQALWLCGHRHSSSSGSGSCLPVPEHGLHPTMRANWPAHFTHGISKLNIPRTSSRYLASSGERTRVLPALLPKVGRAARVAARWLVRVAVANVATLRGRG